MTTSRPHAIHVGPFCGWHLLPPHTQQAPTGPLRDSPAPPGAQTDKGAAQ